MDEEGWIDVPLIGSFNRLKQLTTDVNLVREMMNISYICDVREMKVRTRDWHQWIMPGAKKASWQNQQGQLASQQQIQPDEQTPSQQ